MANNVINAVFSSSTITYTKPAYQYDYGMILKFSGIELPQAYEVHFSNTEFCGESISQIGDETGVTIPDEMFLNGNPIYAWTYLHTGEDDGETVYKAVISVNKRAKPSDLEPTPVQQDAITQAIAALNVAVEQTAADVVTSGENAQAAANSAEAAGQAKDDAVEAKDKAVDAKNAAETAQGKAEDAQRAAEQAAGSVLGLTADATIDNNVGTPSVEVEVTTESDHKNMSFAFHNLKGERGEKGDTGATGPQGPQGPQGATGPQGERGPAGQDGTDGQDGISPTITVTEISGGHSVEVVDAQGTQTFDVMDGEVSEEQLETALIDKADVITSSASGEIVTIADGGNDLPVVDLKVSLLPVQSGSGDPSPDNVRPISGWTGVDIRRTGKNLIGGTALRDGVKTSVPGAVDHPEDLNNRYIAFASNETNVGTITGSGRCKFKPNTRYTFIMTIYKTSGTGSNLRVYYTDNTYDAIPNVSSTATKETVVLVSSSTKSVANLRKVNQSGTTRLFYDESGIFEGVLTESDFKPYVGQIYPIDWTDEAGTVYGGSPDVTTGLLTDEMDILTLDSNIPSGSGGFRNLAVLSEGVRCEYYPYRAVGKGNSAKVYSDRFANRDATTGTPYSIITNAGDPRLLVCLPLEYDTVDKFRAYFASNPLDIYYYKQTPTTYQLTPVQIATLLGNNSFWSNSNGEIDLEYRADLKLYLEQLTKPTEDDMTANANIASGKFFMVGNRLMLSTTAIAQGEQIVVGTNCSEVSLADALNQINA